MSEPRLNAPLDYATPGFKRRFNKFSFIALCLALAGLVVPASGAAAIAVAALSRKQLDLNPNQRGRSVARSALILGVIGLLSSTTLLWIHLARVANQNALRCQRQMSIIGDCLAFYLAEQGGRFPPNLAALAYHTTIPGTAVFVCPSSNSASVREDLTDDIAARAARHIDYVYVGEGLNSRSAPSEPVLIERLSNHSPAVNVLYANGTTRQIKVSQALTLLEPLRGTPRLTEEEYNFILGK